MSNLIILFAKASLHCIDQLKGEWHSLDASYLSRTYNVFQFEKQFSTFFHSETQQIHKKEKATDVGKLTKCHFFQKICDITQMNMWQM